MEFFFHRYVLHKPVAPFLSYFYKQHTHHHSLTRITRRRTPGGLEVNFVENFYPILEKEQKEASFFPWYTFVIFAAILTPFFALRAVAGALRFLCCWRVTPRWPPPC
jgi:hemolysin III